MGRFGALAFSVPGGGVPQDLDLDTVELFARFFSVEELIANLQLLDLSVRELTILKTAVLHEIARVIAEDANLRAAVRTRAQEVFRAMRPSAST